MWLFSETHLKPYAAVLSSLCTYVFNVNFSRMVFRCTFECISALSIFQKIDVHTISLLAIISANDGGFSVLRRYLLDTLDQRAAAVNYTDRCFNDSTVHNMRL